MRGLILLSPEPRGDGTDQCKSRDAHDRGDQRPPFVVIGGGARSKDFNTPVFQAISRQIAAVVDGDWSRRRGNMLAVSQQSRLIGFDFNDQFIAGFAGDLECLFGIACCRA